MLPTMLCALPPPLSPPQLQLQLQSLYTTLPFWLLLLPPLPPHKAAKRVGNVPRRLQAITYIQS